MTGGINIAGCDLREFSARLQTGYTMGACQLTTDTFQGTDRSSLLLLCQSCGTMELVLPLEFLGTDRRETVAGWSRFCQAVQGAFDMDLGDGYLYHCVVTDLGRPAWIAEGWLTTDVTLQALRQLSEVTISTRSTADASVYCSSTYPKTDCVITISGAVLTGAEQVSVVLGENSWYLNTAFSGTADLILDGVNKRFLLDGENVAARMDWQDFPYLVPGENPMVVAVNAIGITNGVTIAYRPTFL